MLKKRSIIIIVILAIIMIITKQNIIDANTVEYRGEAEGLVITSDDFFSEFGELMPGDKKEATVLIKNTTKDKIEVFFKTEVLPKNENYDEIDDSLLQKLKLKITLKNEKEEKNIYDGKLGAETISEEYISLGEYEKKYNGEFIFEIEVPKELKNAYALSETDVKWVFYVEKKDDKDVGNKDKENTDKKNENNTNNTELENANADNTNSSSNKTNEKDVADYKNTEQHKESKFTENVIQNVKTGDYIYYIIGIITFVIIINVVVIVRRKMKNEK